LIEIYRREI